MDEKTQWIKKLYLYSFSMIGLILLIIGSIQIIDIGLKTFVFTKAEIIIISPQPVITNQKQNEKTAQLKKEAIERYQKDETRSRNQRQASNAIAMIIVGLPLFLYHWNLTKKDK